MVGLIKPVSAYLCLIFLSPFSFCPFPFLFINLLCVCACARTRAHMSMRVCDVVVGTAQQW